MPTESRPDAAPLPRVPQDVSDAGGTLRVCSFESRRSDEMKSLIERHGGSPTVAPSMREIPLGDNPEALSFAAQLLAGRIDVVVFMTGVGAQALLDVVETKHDRREFFGALERCRVVVRGPKPTAILRQWGVRIDQRAPEPNTWRELLATIDGELALAGKTVAVQEYGIPNEDLYRELRQRGASVVPVPVYRWALPEDVGPLAAAIRSTIAGQFDVLMFTSAQQLHNLLAVAEAESLREQWIAAAGRVVVASIGPTATEALQEAGLQVDVEASPPKMGQLVRDAMLRGPKILDGKRKTAR
jgi:uroporphyrinogen-III synthase